MQPSNHNSSKTSRYSIYFQDPDKKSLFCILYEALWGMLQEKELSTYYFSHLLYKKQAPDYLHYIGNKKLKKIRQQLLKRNAILDNKLLFQDFLKEKGLPGPTCLAYIDNGYFVRDNMSDKLTNPGKLLSLFQALLNKNSVIESIFIKPIDGIGGAGTYKLKEADLISSKLLSNIFSALQVGKHIVQESVVQHSAMNRLGSSSLNTVRILSYRKPGGEFGIASALCRMGREGAHVDNASCGGIFVPIDISTGKLYERGYSFISSGGQSFLSHPDTGTIFKNFELPYFDEALKLVLQSVDHFQNLLIGWDIALTSRGPIFIEGNHKPHLVGTQIACGGFKNHLIYKELFQNYL